MGWPTTFAQLAGGNQPLSIFDTMFSQVAQMIAIPCVASGVNSITLSPIANAPILTSYAEFCAFRYKAVATSNGPMSASFLTLPNLPIYLSDGLTPATTGNSVLGQEYVLVFSQALNSGAGGFFIEAASIPAVAPSAAGYASGLVIANNLGTPNTQLDVSVTEVVLNNAAGQSIRFAGGVTSTINFLNNGINGIDTGAINVNQNYQIWAISNGGVLRAMASLSTTFGGLTFPSGFTFAKFLGTWRTAVGVAQLMGGVQESNFFQYRPGIAQTLTAQVAISGGSGNIATPTWTPQPLTNFVPPNVAGVELYLWMAANSNSSVGAIAAPSNTYGGVGSTTNPPPLMVTNPLTAGAGVSTAQGATSKGRFAGAGPVFYASSIGAGSGLTVDGWYVNL